MRANRCQRHTYMSRIFKLFARFPFQYFLLFRSLRHINFSVPIQALRTSSPIVPIVLLISNQTERPQKIFEMKMPWLSWRIECTWMVSEHRRRRRVWRRTFYTHLSGTTTHFFVKFNNKKQKIHFLAPSSPSSCPSAATFVRNEKWV